MKKHTNVDLNDVMENFVSLSDIEVTEEIEGGKISFGLMYGVKPVPRPSDNPPGTIRLMYGVAPLA